MTPWVRGLHRLAINAALIASSLCSATANDWQERLVQPANTPFPDLRSLKAEYVFGWADLIEAAEAEVVFLRSGQDYRVDAKGRTIGLTRALWSMEATHEATGRGAAFEPIRVFQFEDYRRRDIRSEVLFEPDAAWRFRDTGSGNATWKRMQVPGVRDVLSSVLLVRSLPLRVGDEITLTSFPWETGYLIDLKVLGKERIHAAGLDWPALKLDLKLQKIVRKDGLYRLEPQTKFRNGSVWVSDDENRIPLRVEVNVFIGFVYGELRKLEWIDPLALVPEV